MAVHHISGGTEYCVSRKRRLNVSRLQKNRFKPSPGQAGVQPLRQRPRFEADPRNREAKPFKALDEHFRFARDLDFPHNLAASVDNAHARPLQRHIDSSMMFRTCPPFRDVGVESTRTPFPSYRGTATSRLARSRTHYVI